MKNITDILIGVSWIWSKTNWWSLILKHLRVQFLFQFATFSSQANFNNNSCSSSSNSNDSCSRASQQQQQQHRNEIVPIAPSAAENNLWNEEGKFEQSVSWFKRFELSFVLLGRFRWKVLSTSHLFGICLFLKPQLLKIILVTKSWESCTEIFAKLGNYDICPTKPFINRTVYRGHREYNFFSRGPRVYVQ